MKISVKLITSLIAAGGMTAVLATFAVDRLSTVHQAERVVEEDIVPSSRHVAALDDAASAVRMADLRLSVERDPVQRARYTRRAAEALATLEVERRDYRVFADTPAEDRLYTGFVTAWDAYMALREGVAIADGRPADSATVQLRERADGHYDRASTALHQLTALTIQQAADATARSEDRYAIARATIILWAAASLLVGFYFAWLLRQSIGRPLATLVSAAKRVGHGDLSHRVTLATRDEFEELAATFNWMAEALALAHETLEQRVTERTAELLREKDSHSEARLRAEAANVAKGHFLANMSHELRTPLNAVIGFAGILLRNPGTRLLPKDLSYVERIQSNGRHLLALINTILDLSKVDAGRVKLEESSFSLCALVHATLADLESVALVRDVKLEATVPDGPCVLEADRDSVRQILVNLVANAIKFSEHGVVRVIVEANPLTGAPWRIAVVDRGIGIPADRLESVFDAFQQADNTTARKYGGTGLGLTISQSLARMMGYTISVESTVGVGSTFSLVFEPGATAFNRAA